MNGIDMIQIRLIIYGLIASSAIGLIYYYLNSWHYKPLEIKDEKIQEQKAIIADYAKIVNEAYSKLYTCEQNATASGINDYIDGLGEIDEVHTSTLDNLGT